MFLQDFREGKTDEELMRLHELTPGMFAKLIKVLQEKKLLDPAELKSRRAAAPREPEIRIPEPYEFTPAEPVEEIRAREGAYQGSNSCPLCGAHVNERMLSCPECGHVLPATRDGKLLNPRRGGPSAFLPECWGVSLLSQ